jgi:tetratricopeptide (TPR) repeat protein
MARALELNPASAIVRRRYATSRLMPFGRFEEAISDLALALELDPLGTLSRMWLLAMFWLSRQYDRGVDQGRMLVEIDPTNFASHFVMGLVCREARRFDDGISALRKAARLSGGSPLMLGWLGLALAESGGVTAARELLGRLRTMSSSTYVPPTSFAWIHVALGEVDEFFEWMDRGVDARDHMIMPIKSYPFLDRVRDDRRYDALLRRMNLH